MKEIDPVKVSKKKRTKFYKSLYCFFDAIMPRNHWPFFGKIANRIRVHLFRKISPQVSKRISIDKGCEIYPCITIEDGVVIGLNVHLNWCVTIKKGTKVAKDVYFNTQNWIRNNNGCLTSISSINPITVGENCWIGTKSVVLGGVVIGNRTTIGAASVVTKSIPENSLAVGNPAIVKKQFSFDKI